MATADYLFSSLRVRLTSDLPEVMAWAEETLQPYFRRSDGTSPPDDHVVARFAGPPEPVAGPGELQALFLGRQGTRHGKGAGTRVLDVASGHVFALFDDRVIAHYTERSPYVLRDPARLVRECAVDRMCARGGLRLHAAAVAIGGSGVLIVGARNSGGTGKSSTLAHLLAEGADFIANDRLLAVENGHGVCLLGLPVAIRWGADQLDLFERARAFRADYGARSSLRMTDAKAGYAKYELTPCELSALTGRPIRPHAPLAAVVVVDRTAGSAPSRCARTRPSGSVLSEAHLERDPAFPSFFRTAQDERATGSDRFDRLLDVPWYRLTGGHLDIRGAAELVDHIQRQGT